MVETASVEAKVKGKVYRWQQEWEGVWVPVAGSDPSGRAGSIHAVGIDASPYWMLQFHEGVYHKPGDLASGVAGRYTWAAGRQVLSRIIVKA